MKGYISKEDLVSWLIDQVHDETLNKDSVEHAAVAIRAYEHVINKVGWGKFEGDQE